MAAKSCIFNEDSSSKSGASAADVPNIEKSYVSSTSSSNSNDTGVSQQQQDAFSSNDIQRPPFLASSTTNLELKSTNKNGNDTTINVVHKLATLFDDKGREKNNKGRRSEILVGKFVQKSVVTSSDASRLRRNISSTSSLRSRSTDSRGRTVETTCNQSIMTSSFDLTDDVGADLNFLDSKSKFTSARAMFEDLERRSRHTTRNSIPKTPDSSSPKEKSSFVHLFSDKAKYSPPEGGVKLSPKTAAGAPPVPPKPKNIASPIVTSPIRVSGLNNEAERTSPSTLFMRPDSPKKETFLDDSSKNMSSNLDFSALNNVADEFTQLVNNLFNIESMENIPVTSPCAAPTCLGYGAVSNTTVITYSDSSSSSSTKIVCNESPIKESATIYIPDNYRSSSKMVNSSSSPTTAVEPDYKSLVTIKASTSKGVFETVDRTKGAVVTDSNLSYVDETDEAKSNVSFENEKIVVIPVIEQFTLDEMHAPSIGTEAVRFRNRNFPSTTDTGPDEDSREIKSLSCHVSVPQDFEADLKRLSTCSMESSAIEHMVVSNFDKYLISNDAEIHWISETDFYIEVPSLNDSGSLDLTTATNEYKPPSKIKFSSEKIRVFSTYSPEEYDRRNEDIDPISASAEYELERRLEKMDIIDVEIDKGNEGLGISIIGMGVGADAGLEKLGIFVKSITPGGPIYRDGRVFICDQIVEVDGKSLVGVSQTYAASVLRSTNGIVKFKLGREKDLETSEIAQLIRQSLEQDHMAIVKEQENLAKRLNMSNDVNTLIPKDEQLTQPMNNAGSAQFLQSPSTPVRNENTRESSLTSDSVFGDENPTKISSENRQIDQLISELRKQDDSPFIAHDYGEKPSPTTTSNVHYEKSNSFRMEGEEEELSKIHPLPDHYSRDSGLESKQSSHDKSNKHPFFDHKHYSLDVSDDEEKLISKRIDFLEITLNDVKRDAEKYQQLLVDSQCHYFDLQKQYDSAKKRIKDFENREKNMIEREEACLKELREKDSQYTLLVQQLYDRVAILERQLNEALKKRSSLAETNGHSVESYGYAYKNIESTDFGAKINTDTSPALAYLPGKKVSERDAGETWPKKSGPDSKPRSVSFEDECATTSTDGITSISTYPMNKYSHKDRRYDNVHNHSFDFGIPETLLLDNKAAKSKADAVKQSLTMCARSLPSRHADAEVFVICHHTMEHAEHLKHHPCHVITEMPCTCPKMSTEQDQNELSPCKDSLTSASSSSCQNNTLSSNNNSSVILKNNGLTACPSTNHNDAQNSSAAVNSAFNSPLISRKLADLLSRRRKSSPNISATNRGNSGKDLERTMCGGRDHGADKLSEVQHWNYEDVNNFLRTIGMEKYQADFTHSRIDGCKLLQLDGTKLKAVGVTDNNDRALIKKRVKQMKLMLEKERKKETKKLLHIPLLDKDRRLLKR